MASGVTVEIRRFHSLTGRGATLKFEHFCSDFRTRCDTALAFPLLLAQCLVLEGVPSQRSSGATELNVRLGQSSGAASFSLTCARAILNVRSAGSVLANSARTNQAIEGTNLMIAESEPLNRSLRPLVSDCGSVVTHRAGKGMCGNGMNGSAVDE